MGRAKLDRSDKIIQTFETSKPLKQRLEALAQKKDITVSALIRDILERYIADRED